MDNGLYLNWPTYMFGSNLISGMFNVVKLSSEYCYKYRIDQQGMVHGIFWGSLV